MMVQFTTPTFVQWWLSAEQSTAIIYTNGDLVYRRIYASVGFDRFMQFLSVPSKVGIFESHDFFRQKDNLEWPDSSSNIS